MSQSKMGETSSEISTERQNDQLSKNILFSMLSNDRRRYVLNYLEQHASDGNPLPVRELSEQIAAFENECSPAQVTYKQRKRVHTSLYQSHLPVLHKNGIIDYDQRAGTVSLAPGARQFEPYLDSTVDAVRRWTRLWLALGVGAVIFTGAVWLDLLPLGGLNPSIPGIILASVVFLMAVIFAFRGPSSSY